MKDKVGTIDEISFVLNGKPIEPALICPKCGIDRLKNPCPNPTGSWSEVPSKCPMVGKV